MALFSQSINFDEDVIKNLEEIENAGSTGSGRITRSQTAECDFDRDLEIIDESPTNKLRQKKKYMSLKERSTQTKRRVLKRNKSDSVVRTCDNESIAELKKYKSQKLPDSKSICNNGEFNESLSKYFQSTSIFDKTAKDIAGSENLFSSFEINDSKKNLNDNNISNLSPFFEGNITLDTQLNQMLNESKLKNSKSHQEDNFKMSKESMNEEELVRIFASSEQESETNKSRLVNPNLTQKRTDSCPFSVSMDFDSSFVPNFKSNNNAESTNNTIGELAIGDTDNVTFTQDCFVPPPNVDDKAHISDQKSMQHFVVNELNKCKKAVKNMLNDEIDNLEDSDISMINTSHNNSRLQLVPSVIKNRSIIYNSEEKSSLIIDTTRNLRLISNWGLPASIIAEYKSKGIVEMFEWQTECLSNKNVLFKNSNLVYSAPTSAGKTLISEILMIKNVVERKKKALFILPFVSVVREKMYYLQELLTSSGLRVEGFFGGHSPAGSFESIDISVCTIEKANSIVNKLLESNKLSDIGAIVIDEIHLISDASRGYILELLLTKILYMCKKYDLKIQIVVMSATIPNLSLLQKWLKAELYYTDFRPVDLIEMIKIDGIIYNNKMEKLRNLETESFQQFGKDQDNIAQLCIETITDGYSVIIFCPSKDWCETLCLHIASFIYNVGKSKMDTGIKLRKELKMDKISELKTHLQNCSAGLDTVLEKTINYGCAFHHAGLTTEEREITETAFKNNILRVLVATSTLSSGVNLPARRVIIRTPLFGGKPMCSLTYRQMIGRAGRKGKDTLGESILICTNVNATAGKNLIVTPLSAISSCLDGENNSHLKRAILEIIASGVASTKNDIKLFINSLLLCVEKGTNLFKYFENDDYEKSFINNTSNKGAKKTALIDECSQNEDPIANCIAFLIEYEFIRLQLNEETNEMNYISTRLGNACLASSMPPSDGFLLFSELQKSRQCFVLECELHAIYLVTPYSVCYQLQDIDWLSFLDIWEKLPTSMKRVGDLVGIKDSFLVRAMRKNAALDYKTLQIHKRFYIALALQELVNEIPICEVSIKYKCSRGLLQSLQQLASTFAGIVTAFCTSLNWNLLSMIVSQFKDRLFFGIHQDLLDLMKISNLNSLRARALFSNGIKTLVDLANSDALTIEKILHNCMSFDSGKQRENENEYDLNKRNELRNLYITGKSGVTVLEAARLLINEARGYLQHEIGLKQIEWSLPKNDVKNSIASGDTNSSVVINNSATSINDNSTNQLDINKSSGQPVRRRRKRTAPKIKVDPPVDSKEIENLSLLNSSHILSTEKDENTESVQFSKISVINLMKNRKLVENFIKELDKIVDMSISIGVSKINMTDVEKIGNNLLDKVRRNSGCKSPEYNAMFDDRFYVEGIAFYYENSTVCYLNMQPNENDDPKIKQSVKYDLIKIIFGTEKRNIIMYDAKEHIKVLLKIYPELSHHLHAKIQDPCVAHWLLQPEVNCSLLNMVNQYTPECSSFISILSSVKTISFGSFALNHRMQTEAKTRACIECFLSHHIVLCQREKLEWIGDGGILNIFLDVEMPIQSILASMEVIGFPVDSNKLFDLSQTLALKSREIEIEVYKINGRKFNIASTLEVTKVLGLKSKTSTAKNVLEKIDTPISNLIMQYRKLTATLNNTILPLQKLVAKNRICGNSFSFTITGRISMHEPNLQNVAKDFEVKFLDEHSLISSRQCFETTANKILLSADFCQLELRILTHFSQDKKLLSIMKSNVDVFKGIAAKWNKIAEEKVTDKQRNDVKQICYGIIYGMSMKSLAESLNCDEDAAKVLSDQFHTAYPGIKKYTEKIVLSARENGYVETITNRRRYLPNIESDAVSTKNQAERQAINTTIQGSAADIAKYAIIRMSKNLKKIDNLFKTNNRVELVLHMHDELIYEVPINLVERIANVLKHSMENCVQLDVPLKVKVKTGKNWGELNEIKV